MIETGKKQAAGVAVVLAAGIGERLHPLTLNQPKALVEVGSESILARSVRLLVEHGVKEIVLATGFEDQAVRAAMSGVRATVHFCPNSAYRTTQNAMSLLRCATSVGGRSFYKVDGDLLFRPEVLDRLDAGTGQLTAAVDCRSNLGAEEMKVRLGADGFAIEAFGKDLDPDSCHGESIGIERVNGVMVSSLFHALEKAQTSGQTHLYYEDVYSRLISKGLAAGAADVSDLPWAEVDTPEDLAYARELVDSGTL